MNCTILNQVILGDGPLELLEPEHLWPDRVLWPEGVLDEGGHVQVEEQRVSRVHAGRGRHLQLGRPHRHVGGLTTAAGGVVLRYDRL